MKRRALVGLSLVAAATASFGASATTLAADSLLCESTDSLQFVNTRSDLKSQPASVVIKEAQAGLAAFKMRGPGLDTIGSVPRTRTTPLGEDGIISLASYCVASENAAEAKVVERRQTQGFVKVQTVYQGRRVERWVFGSALKD